MIIGYTAGVYDLFHIGHLNLLKNAKGMCDKLVVGVSTDELAQYKDKKPLIPFEDRLDKYKDQVQFVFKPHPLLKGKLYNAEGWGREKANAYYEAWANAENSAFIDTDYVDLFKSSDALIHDCGSFIVEYLYVQKPVMHLNTGQIKEELNVEAMEAYQAHYLMNKTEDIEKFITEVVLKGKDTKREDREADYKKLLIPPHNHLVADNILNEIEYELSDGVKRLYYNLKKAICQAFKI